MRANLADTLERLTSLADSVMSANTPGVLRDETSTCALCLIDLEREDHDPDCAWHIARNSLAPSDLSEVRRLVRILRYER